MINHIYQLTGVKTLCIKYEDISFSKDVIVQPEYMAICHADQRYFQGKRDSKIMCEKLPMALIHECCGRVIYDPTGEFKKGQTVVLIPNMPPPNYGTIYENYARGAHFLSSGYDGFMKELISIVPDRVVPYQDIEPEVATITEFVSVAVHASERFDKISHEIRDRIGIWGDGSLAYVVANVIKLRFPMSKVTVIGKQQKKLAQFSFVDETYTAAEIPDDLQVDHAFECCGGEGSYYAIQDIIRYINPQGTLILMGVSENQIPVETRMVLEKGITIVGCSRSGRRDFEYAVTMMRHSNIQQRLKRIIFEEKPVSSIGDIHKAFEDDMFTPFKTVFKWNL